MFFRYNLIALMFFLFSTVSSYSQEIPRFVKLLRAQGADSIIFYSKQTIGRTLLGAEVDYFIWKLNGKTCMQKFADSLVDSGENLIGIESFPLIIDSSLIHDYIGKNFQSISDSRIMPLVLRISEDGRDLYYSNGKGFHPTISSVVLHLKDTVFKFEVDEDDVQKDHSIRYDDGNVRWYRENANYNWNSSTALWKFIQLTEQYINQLEEKKLFIYKPLSR